MGFVSALTAELIIVGEQDSDAQQVCTRQCHSVFKGSLGQDRLHREQWTRSDGLA